MKPIQILVIALAFIFGGFIIFQIEEYRLVRQQSSAVKIAKEQAVTEQKYKDSLVLVRSWLSNLIERSSAREDSMRYLIEKQNHVKTILRFIHPEPLPPDSIEIILANRHYYTSEP